MKMTKWENEKTAQKKNEQILIIIMGLRHPWIKILLISSYIFLIFAKEIVTRGTIVMGVWNQRLSYIIVRVTKTLKLKSMRFVDCENIGFHRLLMGFYISPNVYHFVVFQPFLIVNFFIANPIVKFLIIFLFVFLVYKY